LALLAAAVAFLFSMMTSSSTSSFGFSALDSGFGASFGLGPSSQVLSVGASSSLGSYSLPQATGLIIECTVWNTSGLTSELEMSGVLPFWLREA